MILEVCVDSLESLLIAKKAGADRIAIMLGSEVNVVDIENLSNITRCTHYHMSGRKHVNSGMKYREHISRINMYPSELMIEKADFDKLKLTKEKLDIISFGSK
ncbi:hypothetical protein ACTNDY_13655 [Tissierellaceae bacterium HCP3S3_D8]